MIKLTQYLPYVGAVLLLLGCVLDARHHDAALKRERAAYSQCQRGSQIIAPTTGELACPMMMTHHLGGAGSGSRHS